MATCGFTLLLESGRFSAQQLNNCLFFYEGVLLFSTLGHFYRFRVTLRRSVTPATAPHSSGCLCVYHYYIPGHSFQVTQCLFKLCQHVWWCCRASGTQINQTPSSLKSGSSDEQSRLCWWIIMKAVPFSVNCWYSSFGYDSGEKRCVQGTTDLVKHVFLCDFKSLLQLNRRWSADHELWGDAPVQMICRRKVWCSGSLCLCYNVVQQ